MRRRSIQVAPEQGEQLRPALGFIDDQVTVARHEEPWVGTQSVEVERVLEVQELVAREGQARQRRLADLARSHDGHGRKLARHSQEAFGGDAGVGGHDGRIEYGLLIFKAGYAITDRFQVSLGDFPFILGVPWVSFTYRSKGDPRPAPGRAVSPAMAIHSWGQRFAHSPI